MTLYYQEHGNKNASLMVFLHGGGVSSWMWEKQIQHFTDYHCVLIDLPEQGLSKNSSIFSIKYSAKKVIELIEKLSGGKEVIVIGFSLGAQVAVQMLSIKPDLINYTIINSALVRPAFFIQKLIRPSIRFTFPLIKNKRFSKFQAKALYLDKDYFDQYYQDSSQMKFETLVRILEENMSFKIPDGFNKAQGKILVTVGEKENSLMKKSALDLILSNPNCTGAVLFDVGHGAPIATPDSFNRLADMWLEKGEVPEKWLL